VNEAALVDAISTARYVPLGRGPEVFDCWGLVLWVLGALGRAVPVDPMQAARTPREMVALFERHYRDRDWRRVSVGPDISDLSGAVLFFPRLERAVHVAVLVNGLVLDCERRVGVRQRTIAQLAGAKWEAATWVQ